MQVYSNPPAPMGRFPSPTLTNPEMILPQNASPTESTLSTPRKPQRPPSPPVVNRGHLRTESSPSDRARVKTTMSPFHNGVLRRHDGSLRVRSISEKGDRTMFPEQFLLPTQDTPLASSPILQDNPHERNSNVGLGEYLDSAGEAYGQVETRESIYNTPSILDEDEKDPHSHAAMTRRAEEILANAKKRLTDMEGNLNRARSTLERRPSSSMSSFNGRNTGPVSQYAIPGRNRNPTPSKHRQGNLLDMDDAKQGHYRVSSETSVPSSLQTVTINGRPTAGKMEEPNGLGISGMDATTRDRHSEPGRNWFWNGLSRNGSVNHPTRHNHNLQALNEDGPPPQSFENAHRPHEDIREEEEHEESLREDDSFSFQHPPQATGISRARSNAQMSDLRGQMQDLKGKISTLKERARADSLRRRSLQSLRTPSPFTAAPEQWYTGVSLVQEPTRATEPGTAEAALPLNVEIKPHDAESALKDSGQPSPVFEQNGNILEHPQDVEEQHSPDPEDLALTDSPILDVEHAPTFPSKKERLILGDADDHDNHEIAARKERVVIIDDSPTLDEDFDPEIRQRINEQPSPVKSEENTLPEDEVFDESSVSPPIERHEDRPDAFDYEHFILHSAMGSYSGVGMRQSSSMRKRASSGSSTSSVETTKPRNSLGEKPDASLLKDNINIKAGAHGRQDSVDSLSTVDTFATAHEGQDGTGRTSHQVPDHPKKHKGSPEIPSPSSPYKTRVVRHISSAQKGMPNGRTSKSLTAMRKSSPPQPPDLLTYLATLSPREETAPIQSPQLGDRDKELVEELVKSLAKICTDIQALGVEGNKYEARIFRRKLDAARRVLDGKMNGEAF